MATSVCATLSALLMPDEKFRQYPGRPYLLEGAKMDRFQARLCQFFRYSILHDSSLRKSRMALTSTSAITISSPSPASTSNVGLGMPFFHAAPVHTWEWPFVRGLG